MEDEPTKRQHRFGYPMRVSEGPKRCLLEAIHIDRSGDEPIYQGKFKSQLSQLRLKRAGRQGDAFKIYSALVGNLQFRASWL